MKKDFLGRLIFIIILITAFSAVFFVRLFSLQIVNGEKYRETSMKSLVKTIPLTAQRGDILDRYGRVIVTSQISYKLEISKYNNDNEELNQTLYKLILLMQKENQPYVDKLPISQSPYIYTRDDKTVKEFLKSMDLQEDLSANRVIHELQARYNISKEIPNDYLRNVISVRSEMELRQFSRNNAYVFAKNVNMNIVTIIKESDTTYPGVNIVTSYDRMYPHETGAHFLGRVGPIYKEEYALLKDKGYGLTDVIGKEGVEKVYDMELKGSDGILKLEQNNKGKIVSTSILKDAVLGNDVILTIDLNLQLRAEKALEDMINELRRNVAPDVGGGSVCVQNINSGEILAMASYPTYSISNFDEDYEKNYHNKQNPFWNRSISGTYAPGSTYKILTSVAALESGTITPNDKILDKGKYTFYKDYQPVCHIYPGSHGSVNVADAIKFSCNYFFYDVGRRMGIDTIDEYSRKFGLGELTGIEIPGESKGVLASKEGREKRGEIWYPGDTLQAAIGQSDNLFTPLQLSNYIATVVNGGTRYQTHLLYKIKDPKTGGIKETIPKVLEQTPMVPANYTAVMNGMKSVAEDGTASRTFGNFEIAVGGKTGTAEVNGTNNALFVAFAPYENPEISISVVVEHGAHGNMVAPVAKEVFTEYFINGSDEITDEYEKYKLK